MDINKEKVSIIIPFHNAKKYISNCIECLFNQTYKNFEIIFINDGSTDGGQEIIENIIDNNKIKLINIKKSGVSEARNIGIANSTGKYLSFMDIDDYYKDNYLEVMVDSIQKSKSDIVLCNYIEKYKTKEVYNKLPWNDCIIYKDEILEVLLPSMIGKSSPNDTIGIIRGLVWRTFINKEFYEKYNIKFNKDIAIAEDLLFLIELYAKADKIYISSEYLYVYNRFSGSTLDKYIPDNFSKQIYFHEQLIDCLKKNKVFDKNKSRYAMNRMKMYTCAISNAVRCDCKKEAIIELQKIISNYKKDKILNNCDVKFSKMTYITLLLMRFDCKYIIYILYRAKEWIRRRNLSN